MSERQSLFVPLLIVLFGSSVVISADAPEPAPIKASHSEVLRKHKLTRKPSLSSVELPSKWEFIPESRSLSGPWPLACGGDLDGDGFADVVFGEPLFDNGRGRILFFFGAVRGLPKEADLTVQGEQTEEFLGENLQMVGDLNGDGLDDIVVSGKKEHAPGDVRKFFTIYYGGKARTFQKRVWHDSLPIAIGDVNGDGYDDIAVAHSRGIVFVYYGSFSNLSLSLDWTATAEQKDSLFGHDVAGAGDVNGDGFDDLLIGAMKFNGRYKAGGKAYLYLGSKEGLSLTNNWSAEYDLPVEKDVDGDHEQFFSWGLSGAGDVNKDGFDDVVIGACFAERGDPDEGLAFLFLGSKSGLKRTSWIAEGNHPHALFGQALCSAFDVNGDGFDDVLIGMPEASDGQPTEGVAAIYHGSRSGLSRFPVGIIGSDHSHEMLGTVVRSAGDVNGDGYADVLLFGPGFEKLSGGGKYGRALICFGSSKGLPFDHQFSLKKPTLVAVQQRFERYHRSFGSVVYWGPSLVLLLLVTCVSFFVKMQDRRRIQLVLHENRKVVSFEERTRIARNIHDHLGADLTQIALKAKAALTSESPTQSKEEFTSILTSTNEALENIDELIWLTDSRHDSLESLVLHIGDFVTGLLGKAGVSCELDFPEQFPKVEVSASFRHEIFSVSKELARNIVKHAGATAASLGIRASVNALEIELKDNGRGFNVPEDLTAGEAKQGTNSLHSERNGLSNVLARIKSLNGSVKFCSTPGTGTKVKLTVPLTPKKERNG